MRHLATVAVTTLLLLSTARALAAREPDEHDSMLTEEVTVTAGRLPDAADTADRVPANVTVITRKQIERAGSVNLADLLAGEAGFVFYDQTGNGVQTTLDMRGFTNGSGTRVFLDGAPLNDGVNNTLALELVPIEALERIEILRGSAAALAGGGSEAGVIHLFTRREQALAGALSVGLGSFDTTELGGYVSHDAGVVDFVISGKDRDTDGFRDNADGDLGRLSATVGFDLGGERRIDLTFVDSESDFGNPGALTASELEDDASTSPFNSLDFAEERLGLSSLNFRGPLAGNWTMAANVFARERETESLTTGRAAPSFGGFALDSEASFRGSTVQASHHRIAGERSNVLTVGGEWLDGDTDSRGFSTPSDNPGAIPSSPTTDTTSDRTTYSAFVQNSWNPSRHWTLTAGARHDRDRIERDQTLPVPPNADSRRFSEGSLRGGVNWKPAEHQAVYVSYGEGFLPPTSEELFAFPGFGSNPDLDPENSRSYEIGYRARFERVRFDAGLFRIDTEDEIVYDPDSDLGLFGANVNAGETRRQGVELSVRGRVTSRLDLSANVTLTDTEFRAGDDDGNEIPLVPGERVALGADVDLPAGLALHAEALYVGEQVLDNDGPNDQAELDDYTVVNARLRWRLDGLTSTRNGLRLFVEARNVFDEEYVTRGIFAFDFDAGANDVFLTPAPGRRYLAGAEWEF